MVLIAGYSQLRLLPLRLQSAYLGQLCSRQGLSGAARIDDDQPSTSGRQNSNGSDDVPQRLLAAALPHVKTKGWTAAALVAAAKDLGLSPAVTGILPRREGQLVEHFIAECNEKLNKELQDKKEHLMGLRTNERVAYALKFRLQQYIPVLERWPQALAVAASPSNVTHSTQLLGELVNDIWYAVGDQSTDLSWYTKRATVAAIYLSTELYMLSDPSPGFQDTWTALDRRLHDAFVLGKAYKGLTSEIANMASKAASAVRH